MPAHRRGLEFFVVVRDAAPAHRGFRLGEIHPVVHSALQDTTPGKRDLKPRVAIPTTGLEQEKPHTVVLSQAKVSCEANEFTIRSQGLLSDPIVETSP